MDVYSFIPSASNFRSYLTQQFMLDLRFNSKSNFRDPAVQGWN
jgi:hypothetical protein